MEGTTCAGRITENKVLPDGAEAEQDERPVICLSRLLHELLKLLDAFQSLLKRAALHTMLRNDSRRLLLKESFLFVLLSQPFCFLLNRMEIPSLEMLERTRFRGVMLRDNL